MALRGKKPNDRTQRLKMLLSGPAGVGKTTASIKMPKPYIIDCEEGSVHYGGLIEKAGGVVFSAASMDDVITEVRSLITEKHDYLTLVIDPITTAYHALADEGERKVGTEFHKHYKMYADKFVRRLCSLLTVIDMNVIVTAHEKNLWGKNEKGEPSIVGVTFDGYAKLDYMFDLYLQLERDRSTGKRYANVAKTRFVEFPDLERFEWSYEAIAERYGAQRLEKGAANIKLATHGQVEKFNFLVSKLTDQQVKALKIDKVTSTVEDISDLPADRIAKGIDLIENFLNAQKVA